MASYFDNHRFDNYGAWLDMEDRKNRTCAGKHLGFGYAVPQRRAEGRPKKPLVVQEYSMTSGTLLNRQYDLNANTLYRTDTMRTDAHHYPNALGIEDRHNYTNYQRRTCDPGRIGEVWDPKLTAAVSDAEVVERVRAERAETRRPVDPKFLKILFDDQVRLQPKGVRDLNVDFSCMEIRRQEKPSGSTGKPPEVTGVDEVGTQGAAEAAATVSAKPGVDFGTGNWGWCLGGRKKATHEENPLIQEMIKSRSLPNTLGGRCLLGGKNDNRKPDAFYGTHKGFGTVDSRMRGGKLARNEWAGTFPSNMAL